MVGMVLVLIIDIRTRITLATSMSVRGSGVSVMGCSVMEVSCVDLQQGLLSHLPDLDVVIRGNGADGDEQARDVDDSEVIVEDETRGGDSDDFFEDAGNGQRDDGCALQEGEFGGRHAEGDNAWDEDDGGAEENAFIVDEGGKAFPEGGEAFDGDSEQEEGDEHNWGQIEDAGEGVGGCRVAEQEDLGQAPPETGEEGCGDDEYEADSRVLDFA